MADQTPPRTMTATEFLALPVSSQPMELIDGELMMAPAPLLSHQQIIGRVYAILIGVQPMDQVFLSPVDVHFNDGNVFQPDVVWLDPDNDRCMNVAGKHLRGAPDLVIEVLSSGTAHHDVGKKRQVYERHGVQEYWLVDGAARTVTVLVLNDDTFAQHGLFSPTDTFQSPVLGGAAIDVRKIFPAG